MENDACLPNERDEVQDFGLLQTPYFDGFVTGFEWDSHQSIPAAKSSLRSLGSIEFGLQWSRRAPSFLATSVEGGCSSNDILYSSRDAIEMLAIALAPCATLHVPPRRPPQTTEPLWFLEEDKSRLSYDPRDNESFASEKRRPDLTMHTKQ